MDKEYKKNTDEIEEILNSLENNEYDLAAANKKIQEALTKIHECLEILEKPEKKIKTVIEKEGKLIFKDFNA